MIQLDVSILDSLYEFLAMVGHVPITKQTDFEVAVFGDFITVIEISPFDRCNQLGTSVR